MLKRIFDIFFSLAGLIVLSPAVIVLMLFIKITSTGPIFYNGVRVGRYGKPFIMYKFRTMIKNADKMGATSTAADDMRITEFGAFLRKYRLDELPQLMNVLKGEMSFVGPRPQVPWAVELYTEEEKTILTVRPGITDWASLWDLDEGEVLRGSKNPDEDYMKKIHPTKMKLALQYVGNNSFLIDLKIIIMTIKKIFFG